MTDLQILEEIKMIFQEVFDDESLNVTMNTTSEDIEEWDSLEHINIILLVENRFKVKMDFQELSEINSVKQIVDKVKEKIQL